MPKYLNAMLVRDSFKRFSTVASSKAQMERTSGLMYFLALSLMMHGYDAETVFDFNPNTGTGQENRKKFLLEYERLVTLHPSTDGSQRYIKALGLVSVGGRTPSHRASSNFLTTPLKKASDSSRLFLYPGRPAPVLKMGRVSTGIRWGVTFCDEWEQNLPQFLQDSTAGAPFTDLSIIILRQATFDDSADDLHIALVDKLNNKYCSEMASFFSQKMKQEKIFFKQNMSDAFVSDAPKYLTESDVPSETCEANDGALEGAFARIAYLEKLLRAHGIDF